VLTGVDLRLSRNGRRGCGLLGGGAAQDRLHHHGASVRALEQGRLAARAQTIIGAESSELNFGTVLAGEQVLLKLRGEGRRRRGPFSAIALLSSAMRDHRHRNRSGREAHDRRCTLAHGQRVPFDLNHHLGPYLTRKNSQSTPEQR